MKKIASIIFSATTALSLLVVPVVVHAQQDPDPIVIDTQDTTELPETGATETPTTPDTGFAPPSNKLVQNAAVFMGGSLLGIGLGYGVINLRKKQIQK